MTLFLAAHRRDGATTVKQECEPPCRTTSQKCPEPYDKTVETAVAPPTPTRPSTTCPFRRLRGTDLTMTRMQDQVQQHKGESDPASTARAPPHPREFTMTPRRETAEPHPAIRGGVQLRRRKGPIVQNERLGHDQSFDQRREAVQQCPAAVDDHRKGVVRGMTAAPAHQPRRVRCLSSNSASR